MAARGRQWSFAYCRHGGAGQAKELCRLSSRRRVEMKGLMYYSVACNKRLELMQDTLMPESMTVTYWKEGRRKARTVQPSRTCSITAAHAQHHQHIRHCSITTAHAPPTVSAQSSTGLIFHNTIKCSTKLLRTQSSAAQKFIITHGNTAQKFIITHANAKQNSS